MPRRKHPAAPAIRPCGCGMGQAYTGGVRIASDIATGLTLAACLALGLLSGCAQTDADDRPFLPAPTELGATGAPTPITRNALRDVPDASGDFSPVPAMRSTLVETPASPAAPPQLRKTIPDT